MLVHIRNLNQWEWVWLNHNVTSFLSNPLQSATVTSALNHPHLLLWLWIPTHTVLDTITQGWEKGTARPYYPTRKQTWQSSHPYSSKSCWSIPRHYPKSKGIWGRSTYYTVINTGSNSCLIALFTGSSPVFFFAKEEKAWTISSHTCWHTLCD